MKHGFLKHAVHIAALCICLAAGLLMEQDEQWSTGMRYREQRWLINFG